MNILLVYPEHPDTFWSFKHALRFIAKKANEPPLGLLTVAAMLPKHWEKKLVDMKVSPLRNKDIEWADLVFISAMSIQKDSVRQVIERIHSLDRKIVAGGPLFMSDYDEFDDVDYLFLSEAETVFPAFLRDLKNGTPNHIYKADAPVVLADSPIPSWELLRLNKYAVMDIQYSRGCPYDCDFCDISNLYGRKVRTKSEYQLLDELDTLYKLGWHGSVFFVDDNFIGNKNKLKRSILPAIHAWNRKRDFPFTFSTESSINLADDPELMKAMVDAGFGSVFVGIETVEESSLAECNKVQNQNRDLVAAVRRIHQAGLMVKGGFILGFDSDQETIFKRLSAFIQESGIVTAMVGLLNAPKGTRLYHRMKDEGRLLGDHTGDNMDMTINFVPKMEQKDLVNGYREVLQSIYSSESFYHRVITFFKDYKPALKKKASFRFSYIGAFFKSIFFLGIIDRGRQYFWKMLFGTLAHSPRMFPLAITFMIYGFHFKKVIDKQG